MTPCPPRLIIVLHENGDHDAFLIAYDMVRPTTGGTGHGMCSRLTDLMAAYFAFDINYPTLTQYQLLGLLQTELLHDLQSVFQSVNYVKFMKALSDK